MDKQTQLAMLYDENGKLRLGYGYSLRLARIYYKTQNPSISQATMVRQMLNRNNTLRSCPAKMLQIAIADLHSAATERLKTAKTLRKVQHIEEQTKQILQNI